MRAGSGSTGSCCRHWAHPGSLATCSGATPLRTRGTRAPPRRPDAVLGVAAVLALHGPIHLIGFVVTWRIATIEAFVSDDHHQRRAGHRHLPWDPNRSGI